jgi:hypothetical protein
MKQRQAILLLVFFIPLLISSCEPDFLKYTNKPQNDWDIYVNQWNEDYQPNYKPKYGILQKAVEFQSIDREYLITLLAKNPDTLSVAKKLAAEGWDYFLHEKIDSAMFRFNQCWLMDSTYLECYFGFAAIKEYQGLNEEAPVFYQLAYNHDSKDSAQAKLINSKIINIRKQQSIARYIARKNLK